MFHIRHAGVAHNDLAKEPNLLVCDDGAPAFLDFQLATVTRRRGRLFRSLAWDDLRHLLKRLPCYGRKRYGPQKTRQDGGLGNE